MAISLHKTSIVFYFFSFPIPLPPYKYACFPFTASCLLSLNLQNKNTSLLLFLSVSFFDRDPAMDLRWLLHSTSYLLGNPNEVHAYGEERSSKGKKGYEEICTSGFQMPLHYPRYKKSDYQKMEEWKLDLLLKEYGLSFQGSLEEKRAFAMGAFLWPDQY